MFRRRVSPAIAVNRLGPAEIIDDGRTGWLVEPDDVNQLADAIVAAVDDDSERARRGFAARMTAQARWGWPALGVQMARALDEACRAGTRPPSWREGAAPQRNRPSAAAAASTSLTRCEAVSTKASLISPP